MRDWNTSAGSFLFIIDFSCRFLRFLHNVSFMSNESGELYSDLSH